MIFVCIYTSIYLFIFILTFVFILFFHVLKIKEENLETSEIVNKTYILKRLSKYSIVKQKLYDHTKDEAKILSSLNSIFICKMYGKFQTENELVLVLERVPSGDFLYLSIN
jgi:serine/threonine protein kinase